MKMFLGFAGLGAVLVLTTLIVVGMCLGWGALTMGGLGLGVMVAAMTFAVVGALA